MTTQDPVRPPQDGWRGALQADPLGLAQNGRLGRIDDEVPPPKNPYWALARLATIIALVIGVGYLAGVGETVVLVFVLLLCIVLHELGHFATAKAAGIKVTEFFVGFGPRLWSVRRGETEYGVKALPLGGYCRIIGMNNLDEVDPEDEPRTYRQAPVWRRLTVAFAGSAMHFLIAFCLLFAMFFWTGSDSDYLGTQPATNPIAQIDRLTTGASPAQDAGFRTGDRILAINGQHFSSFEQMASYIQARPGQQLDVTVSRGSQTLQLYPTPVDESKIKVAGPDGKDVPATTKPTGFIGISLDPMVHHSFSDSVVQAGQNWSHVSHETLDAFGRLVTFHGVSNYAHMLTSKKAADNPSNGVRFESAVGVVQLFHQAGEDGVSIVLYLLAVINLSIGLFNLIPLLPLDGGHVVIALYEGVRSLGRKTRYHADVTKMMPIIYLALAAIVFLGASALFLDLRDIVT